MLIKPGIVFGEHIKTEKIRQHRLREDNYQKPQSMRVFLLLFLLFAAVSLLFVRLFFLEIIQGSYYRNLSDSNRIRTIVVNAPRGIIFDRNGVPLVFNTPGFRQRKNGKIKLLSNNEAIELMSKGVKDLEIDSHRFYPYKDIASHVLGYIGQISEREVEIFKHSGYKGGDLIGKTGIEKMYEKVLRGENGKKLVEVDSGNKIIRDLGQNDPISGENITLTLDIKLQKAVFHAMSGVEKGAAIVSTPKGEIISLVSKPSFDSNIFTQSNNYSSISEILLDEDNQPLVNRAISGLYPPGSTFKPIVAAAGLENKIIDEGFIVEDTGVVTLGKFSFSNWYFTKYGKTDGRVDVVKGIKRSNDVFFYKLAGKIGVDSISQMAEKFGVGKKTDIDLVGEEEGIVPSPSWKEKTIGEKWYLGDTYHYGIGQGYLLVTPLQVNVWTQAIANNGIIYKPHLLKNEKLKIKNEKFLSERTVSLIREGMVESCSTGGVAWPLFEFRIKNSKLIIDGKNFLEAREATSAANKKDYKKVVIACKTGTAEHGGENTLPHAWITLFAPAYNPEIIVTILAESSGEGSDIAAPIAKKILEEWFGR